MKRRLAVLFAVVLAVAIGLLGWSGPWKSSLPPFHKASVSIYGREAETVVQLSLAQQEEFHDLFSGIPRDRNPMKWKVLGTVRLFDEAGREVSTVDVFSRHSARC
ncbi:hypothetical protein [Luteolibacter soli]|uniref:Uncharacterized protein n=1 Tax=Luteolibacter soli TaxID=3135280 RepID=A0ABU9ARS2_9BACT